MFTQKTKSSYVQNGSRERVQTFLRCVDCFKSRFQLVFVKFRKNNFKLYFFEFSKVQIFQKLYFENHQKLNLDAVFEIQIRMNVFTILKQCNKKEKLGGFAAQFFFFITVVEIQIHIYEFEFQKLHLKSIFDEFQNTASKKSRPLKIQRNTA